MTVRTKKTLLVLKITGLVVLLFLVVLAFPALQESYERVEHALADLPFPLAPLIYMLLMVVAILVSPIPSSPLVIMAGALFGPWLGMLYTLIGATLGAMAAFALARFFLYDTLKARLHSFSGYRTLQKTDERKLTLAIGMTRLLPQVSFDLISYAAGLTPVSMRAFALATFLGMIPLVALLSFFGALLQPYETLMLAILTGLFVLSLLLWMLKRMRK